MTLKDAAVISGILAVANYFVGFLVGYSYVDVKGAFGDFVFESVKYLGGAFFTTLVTLAGLEQLTKRSKEP